MLVIIKGLYRCSEGDHHGTPVVKPYEVSFVVSSNTSRGLMLVQAAKLIKEKDFNFDSVKTHQINVVDGVTEPVKEVKSEELEEVKSEELEEVKSEEIFD